MTGYDCCGVRSLVTAFSKEAYFLLNLVRRDNVLFSLVANDFGGLYATARAGRNPIKIISKRTLAKPRSQKKIRRA